LPLLAAAVKKRPDRADGAQLLLQLPVLSELTWVPVTWITQNMTLSAMTGAAVPSVCLADVCAVSSSANHPAFWHACPHR
jgi:hypothetical protein